MPDQSQNSIALSQFSLEDVLAGVATIIDEKLKAFKQKEFEEKLISPAQAAKLFQPNVSLPTIKAWDRQGLLKSYRFGGNRVYYKYSEVIEAGKTLKRYKPHKMDPTH